MQQALTSVIDQLILECDDERVRLKEKKRQLEGVRSALVAAQSSVEVSSTSTEPPAKKSKMSKSDAPSAVADAGDDVGKKKKKKEKKDPNAPKRAATAYSLFFVDASKKYKAEHPEVAQKEVMGIVGPMWKELDAKKKAPYEARAALAKAEHAEAVAAYTGAPVASPSSSAAAVAASSPVKVKKAKAVPASAPTPANDSSSSSSSSSSDSDSE